MFICGANAGFKTFVQGLSEQIATIKITTPDINRVMITLTSNFYTRTKYEGLMVSPKHCEFTYT